MPNDVITDFMHWQKLTVLAKVQYIVREATFLSPTGFLKDCRRDSENPANLQT